MRGCLEEVAGEVHQVLQWHLPSFLPGTCAPLLCVHACHALHDLSAVAVQLLGSKRPVSVVCKGATCFLYSSIAQIELRGGT